MSRAATEEPHSEAHRTRELRMKVMDPSRPQLYSAATANGIKVAACLEEIIAARALKGDTQPFDYEPHTVRIRHGESHEDFFLAMNPNGKIPVLRDGDITMWESGAILMYLAERYDELIPHPGTAARYEVLKWLMWGSGTLSTEVKQFGFYYKYCTKNEPYPLHRAEERVKRLMEVLERHLAACPDGHWICGAQYTIADLAIWPWLWALFVVYDDCVEKRFANFASYPNVLAYKNRALIRPASKRALDVTVMRDEP